MGGTIAGEKQRKTLHYLLASQLSTGEIVLGKLLARMLMVFVYLVAAVPLLFLLRLFGGVELSLILVTFAPRSPSPCSWRSLAIFFSTFLAGPDGDRGDLLLTVLAAGGPARHVRRLGLPVPGATWIGSRRWSAGSTRSSACCDVLGLSRTGLLPHDVERLAGLDARAAVDLLGRSC